MYLSELTRIDRETGHVDAAVHGVTLTGLAEILGMERHVVRNLLLDGQDVATAGYVYRMNSEQMERCRETLREVERERLATER